VQKLWIYEGKNSRILEESRHPEKTKLLKEKTQKMHVAFLIFVGTCIVVITKE